MPRVARILLSGLIGAIVCAVLSFLIFFLLTIFDNQKLVEAFAYGLIVGIIGALIGAIIGLAVGIGDLGMPGGGVVGLLVTFIVVAFYVFSTAESFSQFCLGEGVEKDVAKGLWWMEQAVANGEPYAARLLSDVYAKGLFGVEPDLERADYWNERAGEFKDRI